MTSFAQGKYALMISDRSGLAFPYNEMVREWNGAWVHSSEFEKKSPQLQPKPTSADPQALQHARPSRTALPTPSPLDTVPFSTAGTTTLTVNEDRHQRKTGDAVRFYQVKEPVGGVSVAALELNTTLNGDITSTATTIALTDASNFPTSGYIVIRKVWTQADLDAGTITDPLLIGKFVNETVQYTGKSTNDLTGCTRGTAAPYRGYTPTSTTANAHTSGVEVFGSHKIVTRVSTTVKQAGVPSTVTEYNSFSCVLNSFINKFSY